MPFAMTAVHGPEYLLVEATGAATLGDLCGLFDFVRVAGLANRHGKALLDLRAVEIAFGFTDHLALGSHAASALRDMKRVASAVDPKFRVGTSERAAQKMGLALRTFTDIEEARQWLMEPL